MNGRTSSRVDEGTQVDAATAAPEATATPDPAGRAASGGSPAPAPGLRVAFLGPVGTFTESALLTWASTRPMLPGHGLVEPTRLQAVPATGVPAALDAVRSGTVAAAVVPLENSVEGQVTATIDALASGEPLVVVAEQVLPVTFALLVRPGTALDAVRVVTTHPHAAAQCRGWLAAHLPEAEVHLGSSTADAARAVAAGGRFDAAVASPATAARYGLRIAADRIGDNPDAVTRFVVVTRPSAPPPPTGADRTTLVAYARDDHPGALLEILTELAVRGVNLTRLESRPTGEALGRYCFSMDCEGHLAEARVAQALAGLRRVCADVRYLGSYPRADGVDPGHRDEVSDAAFAEADTWIAALRAHGA